MALMKQVGAFGQQKAVVTFQPGGSTSIFVAVNGCYSGSIAVADPAKVSAYSALRRMEMQGIRVLMLTGDNKMVAGDCPPSRNQGVEAEVCRRKKPNREERLQSEGRIVAMAGDGINDAPALAQAQVGIAMGTGTDIAMESGGITLLKGDLEGILRARSLSQATMRNIRQNLFFAFLYNSIGVPIAAGVLYPVFGLLLSPILAAAAMSFSSVSVITTRCVCGK
jgi:P-type Cu+ transporter